MPTILDQIVKTKQGEVAAAKQRTPMEAVQSKAVTAEPPRDFLTVVTKSSPYGVQLIAEIKKASPSAGLIVPDFDPVRIAETYARHGAAALSVLTDETYFQGRLEFIDQIKKAVNLPVLRKDFIVDEYQVYQSRAIGADAILLIAEVLGAQCCATFMRLAKQLGMAVLVEVHEEANLKSILETLGPPANEDYLLGINNRDLTIQKTDLTTAQRLARFVPAGTPLVAESGIHTRQDVLEVIKAGARAILVGESLLRAQDIGNKIDEILGRSNA